MKKISSVRRLSVLFLSVVLISGAVISCKEKDKDVIKPKTITDIINENSDFTILREVIKGTGMSDALRSQELTFFAPSDAAFRSSYINSASVITSLPKDSALSFVKQHLLSKRMAYKDIKKGELVMLNGQKIDVTIEGAQDTTLKIGNAYVLLKNVNADNGVIHVLDRVIKVK